MQIVRIENTGDDTLVIPHNGEKYTIRPGDSKIVPYDAAASLYGDPRARDDARTKGRRDIFNHVRALHNFHLGFDNEETWQAKRPRFVATDPNSNEIVWFVIDDPEGKETFKDTNGIADNTTDSRLLADAIQAMQAQIASMAAQLAAKEGGTAGVPAPQVVHAQADGEAGSVKTAPVVPEGELPKAAPAPTVRRDGPRTAPTGS